MTARILLLSLVLAAPALAQDRSKPPALGQPPTVTLPSIQKRTLSNGLPVWIVEQHEVPVAQIDLVLKSGSAADPAGKYGVASLTAAMLDEGAGARDALQIADAIDFLGAELSTASAIDASSVRLHVPVSRIADALPVMADVALRPTFPQSELNRLRDERLTSIQQVRDDPAEIIRLAFPFVIFGPQHRYGTANLGTTATVKAFKAEDLRTFHAAQYRPSNAALLVAGDVKVDALMPLLEQAFGSWKSAGGETNPGRPQLADPAQLRARRVVIFDKPGSAQS